MRPSHTPGWYSDASSQEGDAIQRNCHAKVRGSSSLLEGCEYTHVKKLLGLVRTEELKNIKCLDDDDSSQCSAQQCELSTGGDLSPKWSSLSSLVTGE